MSEIILYVTYVIPDLKTKLGAKFQFMILILLHLLEIFYICPITSGVQFQSQVKVIFTVISAIYKQTER